MPTNWGWGHHVDLSREKLNFLGRPKNHTPDLGLNCPHTGFFSEGAWAAMWGSHAS